MTRLARAALALASIAAALALAELAVRMFDVGPAFQVVFRDHLQPSKNPALGYELRPGSPDPPYRISTDGLRDRDFSLAKPPGVFRIASLGDSVAYGLGCPRDLTYAKILERLLDAGHPGRVEVLNFGVNGYNLPQIVERLRTKALSYEPDLVLYGYVLNDPQSFSFEAEAIAALDAEAESAFARPARIAWLARSRLYLLGRYALRDRERVFRAEDGPRGDPAFLSAEQGATVAYFRSLYANPEARARLEAGLAELGRISRERELPVVLAIFPIFVGGPEDSGPRNVWLESYPLGGVHALIADAARRNGLHVVDLLEAFQTRRRELQQRILVDFVHPNLRGHAIAGAVLAEWLCEASLVPNDACRGVSRHAAPAFDVEPEPR